MFLFVIPRKVCVRLEKIQKDFLWGSGALEKKTLFGELEFVLCW